MHPVGADQPLAALPHLLSGRLPARTLDDLLGALERHLRAARQRQHGLAASAKLAGTSAGIVRL